MLVNPYLNFDGTCAEAFRFYEKTFGGTDLAKAPWAKDWMMHARLAVGEISLLGADTPPGRYQKPQGFGVSLSVDAPAEAEGIFTALEDGGVVTMPLQETFWAQRFGMVTDRFGIPWMVNCEKPEPAFDAFTRGNARGGGTLVFGRRRGAEPGGRRADERRAQGGLLPDPGDDGLGEHHPGEGRAGGGDAPAQGHVRGGPGDPGERGPGVRAAGPVVQEPIPSPPLPSLPGSR